MHFLLVGWRFSRMLLQLLQGVLICAIWFPFLSQPQRMKKVGTWSAAMLRAFGIELIVRGEPCAGPVLLVANHVSWLDILVINAVQPARFVSKADTRAWPVLGRLVACGGTLFIERAHKRDAMRVVHEVAAALKAGDVVAFFPEGTTHYGADLLPFHANLLQAAIATEIPVQPLVLRYADQGSCMSTAVEFVGDTTLVQSLWRVIGAKGLQARVAVLPLQATGRLNRRALAESLRSQIAQSIQDSLSDRSGSVIP